VSAPLQRSRCGAGLVSPLARRALRGRLCSLSSTALLLSAIRVCRVERRERWAKGVVKRVLGLAGHDARCPARSTARPTPSSLVKHMRRAESAQGTTKSSHDEVSRAQQSGELEMRDVQCSSTARHLCLRWTGSTTTTAGILRRQASSLRRAGSLGDKPPRWSSETRWGLLNGSLVSQSRQLCLERNNRLSAGTCYVRRPEAESACNHCSKEIGAEKQCH
jgi:hypothetical protein